MTATYLVFYFCACHTVSLEKEEDDALLPLEADWTIHCLPVCACVCMDSMYMLACIQAGRGAALYTMNLKQR